MGSHCRPATRHRWTHPTLTPASEADTWFTYPRGMEGRVDQGDLLHTEMVTCLQSVTHPSTNRTKCHLTMLVEASALIATLHHHLRDRFFILKCWWHFVISWCLMLWWSFAGLSVTFYFSLLDAPVWGMCWKFCPQSSQDFCRNRLPY